MPKCFAASTTPKIEEVAGRRVYWRHVGDQTIVGLNADQRGQGNARLHDDIDAPLHQLVEIGVDGCEHPLDVLAGELAQAHRDHHQHDAILDQAVEFVSAVVDDGERRQHADFSLGQIVLEHLFPRHPGRCPRGQPRRKTSR